MKAEGLVSDFAFTGNPIILREDSVLSVADAVPGTFYVQYGGRKIFEGRLDPSLPLEINVADIVDSVVEPIAEVPKGFDPIVRVEDMTALNRRHVYASFSWNNSETEFDCFVFPGGVSRQNFRTYLHHKVDAFSARFLNKKSNFFLTTRSSGWIIPIKETELTPLYFLCNNSSTLKVVERCKNSEWEFDSLELGIFALDIQALRWEFFDEYNVLPSVFDIYRDDMFSCRIVVTVVESFKEHYRVKFRNSFGVFDIIDLIGTATVALGDSQDEDSRYNRYDSILDDYCTERERQPIEQSITIETVLNLSHELGLLRDMLASEDVYLMKESEPFIKVIPQCENLSYSLRPVAPKKVAIKLTFTETERFVMTELDHPSAHVKPRLFTKQFTDNFN